MTVRVGVNGFGRIGRNFWRAVDAQKAAGTSDIEIVAVNDITDNKTLAHLLKYDSILGRLPYDVSVDRRGHRGRRQGLQGPGGAGPGELPWKDLGVDVVIESTGLFTKRGRGRQAPRRRARRRSSSRRRRPARTSPS